MLPAAHGAQSEVPETSSDQDDHHELHPRNAHHDDAPGTRLRGFAMDGMRGDFQPRSDIRKASPPSLASGSLDVGRTLSLGSAQGKVFWISFRYRGPARHQSGCRADGRAARCRRRQIRTRKARAIPAAFAMASSQVALHPGMPSCRPSRVPEITSADRVQTTGRANIGTGLKVVQRMRYQDIRCGDPDGSIVGSQP